MAMWSPGDESGILYTWVEWIRTGDFLADVGLLADDNAIQCVFFPLSLSRSCLLESRIHPRSSSSPPSSPISPRPNRTSLHMLHSYVQFVCQSARALTASPSHAGMSSAKHVWSTCGGYMSGRARSLRLVVQNPTVGKPMQRMRIVSVRQQRMKSEPSSQRTSSTDGNGSGRNAILSVIQP